MFIIQRYIIKFTSLQVTYNKVYETKGEELIRKEIYLEKRALISQHNKAYYEGKETYLKGINWFSDMVTNYTFWLSKT